MIITGSFTAFIPPENFKCYKICSVVLVKLQNYFYVSCILYGCGLMNCVIVEIPLSYQDISLIQLQITYKNNVSYLIGKIRFSNTQTANCKSYHS
jgi:hypothetical protein